MDLIKQFLEERKKKPYIDVQCMYHSKKQCVFLDPDSKDAPKS